MANYFKSRFEEDTDYFDDKISYSDEVYESDAKCDTIATESEWSIGYREGYAKGYEKAKNDALLAAVTGIAKLEVNDERRE